jgi:TolA-binding protein
MTRKPRVGAPAHGFRWLLAGALLLAGVAPALTREQTEDLVKRYLALDEVLAARNYQRATGILQGLVAQYGSSEFGNELRFGLAECYFNLGNYKKAQREFEEIFENPTFSYIEPEALYGFAISSIVVGSYDEADAALQRMVKRRGYEHDPRADFAFGVLRYYRNDFEGAIAKLTNDSLLEATLYLGKSLARVNRPRDALLAFKKITSAVPGTPLATLAHFGAGEALFLNADFTGAEAKFRFFLDNFPDSPLADFAHYFLGCALIHSKQYEDGLTELMPLTKHSNNYLAAHANYFVGYAYLVTDRPRDAVARFQRVRNNYPKTKVASYANLELTQALLATGDTVQTILSTSQLSAMFTTGELQAVGDYLSGVLTLQIGQFARSANFFENILIKYPESPLREPGCALLLMALNHGANFQRTVTVGARYVKDFPDSASQSDWRGKLLYALGEGCYYSRQFVEAEDYYRRAYGTKLSGDIAPYARMGRAFCLMQLDRNDEAIKALRELGGAKPGDTMFTATLVLGVGYGFFNKGEYDSARVNFEFLIEHYSELATIMASAEFYVGVCYRKLDFPGDAIDAWSLVVNKYPDSPKAAEAAFRAGDTYFKSGEYDKAMSLFRFVTERYPYSMFGPSSQAFIGQCYYNQRKFVDAIREHQKFLDLYPSDAQATAVRRSLEMDYYRAGQEDSVYMDAFLKRYPESELVAQARFDRALAMMAAKDFAAAALEFQIVVVNFPASSFAVKAQLNTGECYASLENWEAAAAAYAKYLDYFSSGTERDAALFNQGISYFHLANYEQAQKSFQTLLDSHPSSQYAENAKKNIDVCRKRIGGSGNK